MNLSKTSEYALRILSFMAAQDEDRFTAQHLHKKLNIPHRYLRRLLTKLSKRKFIKSNKGRGGGFSLSKKPNKIFLSEIIEYTQGLEVFESCIFGFENCLLSEECAMHDKWNEAREKIKEILRTTSLADIKKVNIQNF